MSPYQISLLISGVFHAGLFLPAFLNSSSYVPTKVYEPELILSVSLNLLTPQTEPEPESEPAPEVVTHNTTIIEQAPEIPEVIPAPKEIIPAKHVDKTEQPAATQPQPIVASQPAPRTDPDQYKLTRSADTESVLAVPDSDTSTLHLLEQQYTDALKLAIETKKYYPSRARRRAYEGAVVVSFTINREGDIRNIRVMRSSSVRILDKAAVNAVHNVGRFQPIPLDIDREWWEFEIALTYNLL